MGGYYTFWEGISGGGAEAELRKVKPASSGDRHSREEPGGVNPIAEGALKLKEERDASQTLFSRAASNGPGSLAHCISESY